MKNFLQRQAVILALTGLAVTGLILGINVAQKAYEKRTQQIVAFKESLSIPLATAATKFKDVSNADASIIGREVLGPLEKIRISLQKVYEGEENDWSSLTNGSEDVNMLIKLAIVEIDKTIEGVKAKNAGTDVDKSSAELNNLVGYFSRQAETQKRYLDALSWISICFLALVFSAITVWNYRSDKARWDASEKEHNDLVRETGRVNTLSDFIEAMATGNYSIQLESSQNDELSATLITMRDKLKANADEDQRRNWATSGLAQIGEILRASTRNSSDLYDNIVKFVVKYTKSNQGGLFIVNDDDSQNIYLELVACYAFERKKFLTKRVDPGSGLVGQCYLERERIHLREVPQDYVRITSGLGGENPSSCLLVPLKVNENIYGVLELASFTNYAGYEIDLVEKLAETIAATISSVKINESTRMLLERTQQQAEEMKSQEEEMRQNMEELSATQEEMQRKEREYIDRIRDLEEQLTLVAK